VQGRVGVIGPVVHNVKGHGVTADDKVGGGAAHLRPAGIDVFPELHGRHRTGIGGAHPCGVFGAALQREIDHAKGHHHTIARSAGGRWTQGERADGAATRQRFKRDRATARRCRSAWRRALRRCAATARAGATPAVATARRGHQPRCAARGAQIGIGHDGAGQACGATAGAVGIADRKVGGHTLGRRDVGYHTGGSSAVPAEGAEGIPWVGRAGTSAAVSIGHRTWRTRDRATRCGAGGGGDGIVVLGKHPSD